MNAATRAVPPFAGESERSVLPIRETRPFYWSVRREIWENRSVVIAPAIVSAFVFLGSMITLLTLPMRILRMGVQDPARMQAMALKPFAMAPAPVMLTTFVVGMFYCLDALYGERRERSILFWKSLPISDRTAVLSKASIPLLVLPLIGYALSVLMQIAMLVISTPVLLGTPIGPAVLWTELHFFQGLVIMFYGLAVHALWFAPIYGWLLVVSAWAKRAPSLWAVLPAVAIAAIERTLFGSRYFLNMLQYRVLGAMKEAFSYKPRAVGHVERVQQLELLNFLSTPGLWVGLLFAAICISIAMRLRRKREAI